MSARTAALAVTLAVSLAGAGVAAELKPLTRIAVPGTALDSFDISFIDQPSNRYFLGDRSNKAVDVFDAGTGRMLGRIEGFVGFAGSNDTAGPNGVVVIGGEVWAGDGDSTVKVADLATMRVTAIIATGGKNRADEVAYDARDEIFIVTNDADEPPFVTLISTRPGHKVLARIPIDDADGGIEQSIYDSVSGMFLMSIPHLKGDKTTGGIAVIDPHGTAVAKILKVADCLPAGLAQGPGRNLVLGCNAGGKNTNMAPVTVILNADTGAVVATVAGIGAADEVAYSARNAQYYIAARQMPGGSVLGVIDAGANTLVQSIPTGGNAHSVAVSEANGHVFVPLPKTGGPCGGCIAVFGGE